MKNIWFKGFWVGLVAGVSSVLSLPVAASPERITVGGSEYVLVNSSINQCPQISNETPGVVVIFQHNPSPNGYSRTLWTIYSSWNELQGLNPELAYNLDSSPTSEDQFLGCYRLETLDVHAATAPLPSGLIDCVANVRFEGVVKHVYYNDPSRIDWIIAYPLNDDSGGIGVEEYLAIPINGRLQTRFHGSYSLFADGSFITNWGEVRRGLLTYEEARYIVDSWDAPFCRGEYSL